ncbi:hypothetical protein [Psychroflexus planctonicus]|uniref:Uncharacterized protein n=1 Tax=Psychroflexus planctonicus TaxID=1526575 RepID=A0ABQ1SH90_9FLAO|nr:hypothetical protein [Psychroflexus planctonicus]GGE35407.1 hypothetical protein GCM10010832_14470 [Psychroflexus planctonicus]
MACATSQDVSVEAKNNSTSISNRKAPNSTFGKYFTPQGDLRALVVYVNFEEESLDPKIHNDLPHWPIDSEFPVHYGKSVIDENQELSWGYQHPEQFKNIDVTDLSTFENLSAYYYTMSSGKFRMYFETLKHPETDEAISIKISPEGIPASAAGRNELNKRVFEKIRAIYPENYDWSRFDSRKNQPNYKEDLSVKGTTSTYEDHHLDFVILLLRNSNVWKPHPNGSENGVGWRKAIMGTGARNEIIAYQNEQPVYVGNEGVRIFLTQRNLFQNHELLIHEIAHGMISMPHINTSNRAEGNYLFYNYGWGMMDTYSDLFGTANAWERWYAGWTEITHDITPTDEEIIVELADFLAKDQSVRIQLPQVKDEFLWLEHRKDTNQIYYQRPLRRKDRYGKPHPNHQPGLYAFLEKMAPSRNSTFSTNTQGTNGMKVLYGKGNYDYTLQGFEKRYYAWDNEVLQVKNEGENAYAGHHEGMLFRYDFNENGKIEHKTNSNGAGSSYTDTQGIFEIDGKKGFPFYMFNTPIQLTKISAFTNPAITNFQEMDWKNNELAPVILHSLSVEQQKLPNGNLQLKIDYQDGIIENDFRMAGPIVLPKGEVVQLAKNKELTLNKSKTINRVREENGSFIANSYLQIEGELILNENSVFIIDEKSKVSFETNSKLTLKKGAKIMLLNEAKLIFDEATQLDIHSSAIIRVDNSIMEAAHFPKKQIQE